MVLLSERRIVVLCGRGKTPVVESLTFMRLPFGAIKSELQRLQQRSRRIFLLQEPRTATAHDDSIAVEKRRPNGKVNQVKTTLLQQRHDAMRTLLQQRHDAMVWLGKDKLREFTTSLFIYYHMLPERRSHQSCCSNDEKVNFCVCTRLEHGFGLNLFSRVATVELE
ncbi:hypothetical protein ACA910_017970 [Epithemia clementina (nom. ined.)]